MIIITEGFLRDRNACYSGFKYWEEQNKSDLFEFINQCKIDNHLDWANWLLARCLYRANSIKYAIFAAEQVLSIYENKYPDDSRPRKSIEAAKKVIENDNKENRNAANAAYAAYAAANAAYARNKMRWLILEYGMELIKEQVKCKDKP